MMEQTHSNIFTYVGSIAVVHLVNREKHVDVLYALSKFDRYTGKRV